MPLLQDERFIVTMLNPHVEKLEASMPWLMLGANTDRYGRMIREGTRGAEMDMDRSLKTQLVSINQDCQSCSKSSHLSR
jgi:hypothetical protein